MNRGQLLHVLDVSVNRSDVANLYGDWINQAMRSIYRDASFNAMRTTGQFTIPTGESRVAFPDNFKELTKGRSPVRMIVVNPPRLIPCDVMSEDAIVRLDSYVGHPVSYSRLNAQARGLPVFTSWDDARAYLNLATPAGEDLIFSVKYFQFLPDLLVDSDENRITQVYEEMVKAKVKAVAFEEINDPVAASWEEIYQLKRAKALANDAYQYSAGVRLQMGGG